jgi:hypothetical protein
MTIAPPQCTQPQMCVEPVTVQVQEEVPDSTYCSCVSTAISMGANIPLKDASRFIPNSPPRVGAVALFYYPNSKPEYQYHIGYVAVVGTDSFLLKEGNYKKCEYGERWVSFTDPRLRGFYYGVYSAKP